MKQCKGLQALKDDYDAENQAWRRAIADKARKQLVDKENQVRGTLEAERDKQIELVSRYHPAIPGLIIGYRFSLVCSKCAAYR